MPCSVVTSMSSSGHREKSPTLVASGRRSGTTTDRTVTSRTTSPAPCSATSASVSGTGSQRRRLCNRSRLASRGGPRIPERDGYPQQRHVGRGGGQVLGRVFVLPYPQPVASPAIT